MKEDTHNTQDLRFEAPTINTNNITIRNIFIFSFFVLGLIPKYKPDQWPPKL